MKLLSRDNQHGLTPLRAVVALFACGLVPLLAFAAAPGWWSERGVLLANQPADDYAIANQGQLKNIAKAAVEEMDANLPGGAGDELHNLVNSWSNSSPQANDFTPLNLGEVKNVARPFYDRLIVAGLATAYPWSTSTASADDFAVVNVGQVKNLFSFNPAEIDPLYDGDENGLPDLWERQYFGGPGVDPNADPDGDGLTNLQEFQQGTDPTDYYNGATPSVAIVGGDNQQGDGGTYAPDALMVEVRNSAGQLLSNAPATFLVTQGSGTLAATTELTPQSNMVSVRTADSGIAMAYFAFPRLQNHSVSITARAGPPRRPASVIFQFRTSDLPVMEPFALSSSTPAPNPSATPPPPLHYAVIDLGKDVWPMRISNNGWVLVRNLDMGQLFARWKAGVLEQLTYIDPSVYFEVSDMNNTGTVVGTLYPTADLDSGQEVEVAAGVVWQPDNPVAATKISAPLIATTPPFTRPVRLRGAVLKAIDDAGNLLGGVYTGWGYGSSPFRFPDPIVNAYRWSATGGAARALTSGTATTIGFDGPFRITRLNGPVISGDRYQRVRTNSHGRYIGHMIVPGTDPTWPTGTGMVDGRSVNYDPWDINENGIVAGISSVYDAMAIVNADGTRRDVQQASPGGINAFVRHEIDSEGHAKDTPAPQVAGLGFADYTRGWLPMVWEYAPNGEWVPHVLQDLIPQNTAWNLFDAADINDQGMIVGVADYKDPANPQAESESHGYMLVPLGLTVDGNRDGEMSFTDNNIASADQTSEDRPYRFWLNDDDDTELNYNGEAGQATGPAEAETVPAATPDYLKHQIISKRNLEDFARLWIYLGAFQDRIISGDIQVALRWKTVASGTPAINIYPSADGDGSDSYLKSDKGAAAQLKDPFGNAVRDKGGKQTVDSAGMFVFKPDYWTGVTASNPKKCLLFEGVSEGKGELSVLLLNKDGHQIAEAGSVWLDLKNVKKMYERVKAIPLDVVPPYAITYPLDRSPSVSLNSVSDPNGHARDFTPVSWAENNTYIVLVHGWNQDYDRSTNYAETLFKRLWQHGYKGQFAAFRWPTYWSNIQLDSKGALNAALARYNDSEYIAWSAGPALKQFIDRLPTLHKNVIAHSMGNMVVGESLRLGASVEHYAMLHAATSASCYNNSRFSYPIINSGITVADYDGNPTVRSLGYSYWLAEIPGHPINFYDELDSAVGTAWNFNNTHFRPDTSNRPYPAVYNYDGSRETPWQLAIDYLDSHLSRRAVTDPAEAKAYVDRSLTGAIGCQRGEGGAVEDSVNDTYFSDDHGAEWNLPIQDLTNFYEVLLTKLEINAGQ